MSKKLPNATCLTTNSKNTVSTEVVSTGICPDLELSIVLPYRKTDLMQFGFCSHNSAETANWVFVSIIKRPSSFMQPNEQGGYQPAALASLSGFPLEQFAIPAVVVQSDQTATTALPAHFGCSLDINFKY